MAFEANNTGFTKGFLCRHKLVCTMASLIIFMPFIVACIDSFEPPAFLPLTSAELLQYYATTGSIFLGIYVFFDERDYLTRKENEDIELSQPRMLIDFVRDKDGTRITIANIGGRALLGLSYCEQIITKKLSPGESVNCLITDLDHIPTNQITSERIISAIDPINDDGLLEGLLLSAFDKHGRLWSIGYRLEDGIYSQISARWET